MEAGDLFRQVVHVFQVVDFLHLVLQRLHASGVDLGFIHPAGVEVAHLLHVGAGRFFGGGFLGDLVERVVVLLDQLVEAAPARILRRDGIVLQPIAIGIKVEIIARLDRRIHVARIERRRIFLGGRRLTWLGLGAQRGGAEQTESGD